MNARFGFAVVSAALLATLLVSCGKKEESSESAPAPTAAPAATPVDAATAGSVTGSVKLEGTAPKARKINMAADAYCNAQHPGGVSDEEVVADAKGESAT